MNVGELFVSIGVKGAEKTVGAISSVSKGMQEAGSSSLAAKAAILGAMYATEQLFAASGKAGTGLTNFNSLLGVSAQTLQQYQYAARQMGVSNQEVEGTFKSLQGAITQTLLGGNAPKGLARVAQLTGNLGKEDLANFQQHPEQLIQRLQEYAQKEKNAGLRNETLRSFGVGDSMIAAFNRNAFTPQALAKAPSYGDNEIRSLDKANIAWSNLGNTIEMAVGHFNARHGGQLVKDIEGLVTPTLKLAEAFDKFLTKTQAFKALATIAETLATAIVGLADSIKTVNEWLDKTTSKPKDLELGIKATLKTLPFVKDIEEDQFQADRQQRLQRQIDSFEKNNGFSLTPKDKDSLFNGLKSFQDVIKEHGHNMLAPPSPAASPASSTQNINVNQSLNFQHEGKDHKQTAGSVKKAVQDSYRQYSAQGQGS